MKSIPTLLLCIITLASYAQTSDNQFDGNHWNAPYTFAIPFGWSVERSPLQKNIELSQLAGVEDARFAPGWGNIKSDQYWTYAYLWYLNGSPSISEELLENALTTYYTSMMRKNFEGQNLSSKKILPVKTWITELASENGDLKTYYGGISMLDFMSHAPINLNCIIHVKASTETNKTFLFFEVSPKPLNDKTWATLDMLWSGFDFSASEHKRRLSLNAYFQSESAAGGGF
jgi:hypothetical protein